jgi:hypothetical protein
MNPFKRALKWCLRILISFLVITALLASWSMIQEKFKAYYGAQSEITLLKIGKQELEKTKDSQESVAVRLIDSLKQASADQLLWQIRTIESDIQKKEAAQASAYDKTVAILKGDTEYLKGDVELMVLKKLVEHLQKIHANIITIQVKESAIAKLESLRLEHVAAYEALTQKEKEWEKVRNENPREIFGIHFNDPRVIPFSPEWKQFKKLEKEYNDLFNANQAASENFKHQQDFLNSIKIAEIERFKIPDELYEKVLQPLNKKIEKLEEVLQNTWVNHFAGPVSAAIPVAIAILISAMLAPIAIKAFLYYCIAPLVSKRRAICLMPGGTGNFYSKTSNGEARESLGSISAVSQEIFLDEDHELLIHPEYLQSTSPSGKKDTKMLLNWWMPLTSLLAGLIALTRIRGTSHASYVVSSTKDPLSEVAVIEIPAGSAVVIQPHNLVGIIQRKDSPVKIKRRWQLHRLNAWLTLQIRYFVFHGPTTLIIKGCRGVRVGRAENGRSINQAAMIGFSANLVYAPRRCDTFVPYLRGKQELFNDNFSGESGYYIYEEMPHYGAKSSILFGRGLEGLLDTALKIFGI